MGEIVQAECRCGFQSESLMVGFGKQNMDCNFAPVICRKCKLMSVADGTRFPKPTGPKCRQCATEMQFYDHPDLALPVTPNPFPVVPHIEQKLPLLQRLWDMFLWILNWPIDRLLPNYEFPEPRYWSKDRCKCPSCGEMTMSFKNAGMWD